MSTGQSHKLLTPPIKGISLLSVAVTFDFCYPRQSFPERLVQIGNSSACSHSYGLGFVGEGGEDKSHFERDAVDCGKGEGYYEMEGPETARYGNKPAETAGYHQEQGVYRAETVKTRHGAHGGYAHCPVHKPDQQGIEKGIQKGRREEQIAIARSFKNAGIDIKIISENTGLSIEEVSKL